MTTEANKGLPKKPAMNFDQALAEVHKWLDYKRISERKREDKEESINELAGAICDGDLVLNDDHTLSQTLLWPLENKEGQQTVKVLKFKPRIKIGALNQRLKKQGVDADSRVLAYISALTNEPFAIVENIEDVDYKIAQSIVIFFL